jgi:hypothetical protein
MSVYTAAEILEQGSPCTVDVPARWVRGPGLPTDVNLVTPDWPAMAA